MFARQMAALRQYAAQRGIKLPGDMPMFVAADSADVWAAPHLFALDTSHRPRAVAGAPADFFSQNGQCWGLPLYDWDAMARDEFRWWIARVRTSLSQVDAIRLDHFRGFESYWEIPVDSPRPANGRWVVGPGEALFKSIQTSLGEHVGFPFVADDLGDILS